MWSFVCEMMSGEFFLGYIGSFPSTLLMFSRLLSSSDIGLMFTFASVSAYELISSLFDLAIR